MLIIGGIIIGIVVLIILLGNRQLHPEIIKKTYHCPGRGAIDRYIIQAPTLYNLQFESLDGVEDFFRYSKGWVRFIDYIDEPYPTYIVDLIDGSSCTLLVNLSSRDDLERNKFIGYQKNGKVYKRLGDLVRRVEETKISV